MTKNEIGKKNLTTFSEIITNNNNDNSKKGQFIYLSVLKNRFNEYFEES